MPRGAVIVEDVGLVIVQVVGGIEVVSVGVGPGVGGCDSEWGGPGEGLLRI